MTDVVMPRLSDSMEEGIVLTWLKSDGDEVAKGEELVEIEGDKATTTYEAPADGVLAILVEAGTTVSVGEPIARLSVETDGAPAPTDVRDASPGAHEEAAASDIAPGIRGRAGGRPGTRGNGRVPATPVARRLAHVHGVDLDQVTGSGPRGRITRSDVEALVSEEGAFRGDDGAAPAPAPAPAAAPASAPAGADAGVIVQPLTRTQQVIARRMVDAKSTIPDFHVQTDVEIDAAMALRAELKALDAEVVPSYNDFVVKACGIALRRHPRVNASYTEEGFALHRRVDVGIAVAAPDALIVPTITDADSRSLGGVAAEARRLAQRVRDGQITPTELSGATFTVSNLGMYGVTAMTPVINPPQAAILGVGAARAVPVVRDGALAERHVMTLVLACDHRILYGADAAAFLAEVRALLEQPLRLMV